MKFRPNTKSAVCLFMCVRNMGKLFCIFWAVLSLTQCDWTAPADYVSVRVYNKTADSLSVSTGKTFIDVIIPANTDTIVPVVKNVRISAIGKTSGRRYAARTFYSDNEVWLIN